MRFAKFAKVFRFICLPLAILFTLMTALVLLQFVPEISGVPVPEGQELEELIASSIQMAIISIALIVFDIICFSSYSKYKKSLNYESETTYRNKLSGRRKLKIFFRIIGIIIMVFGAIASYAYPPYSFILMIGVVFFVLSFIIRVRSHKGSRDIIRVVDGNQLQITYPKKEKNFFDIKACLEIIQDAFNDGYYEIEQFIPSPSKIVLIFSTPLSNDEIHNQYKRREKFYQSRGKNIDEMPSYFSVKPIITYNTTSYAGDRYVKKVPIYNIKQKVTKYHDGTKKHETISKTLSHYELATYEPFYMVYKITYLNGEPLIANKTGEQVYAFTRDDTLISSEKI